MSQIIGAASPKSGPTSKHNPDRGPNKELRILALFASGQSLNRFEAENHGDHCLPSTISDLQRKHNINFARRLEKVNTRFGRPAWANRYWLEGESQDRAQQITARAPGSNSNPKSSGLKDA